MALLWYPSTPSSVTLHYSPFRTVSLLPHGRSSPAHLCSNGRARLYSTSRASPATAATLSTAVTAGEEADDDAAEADNAGDDGLEDASDARDDGHDAVADSSEHAGDARDDATHDCGVVM